MYKELYIDLVFGANLLLDYFLLRLLGILFKCQSGRFQNLLGALFGAVSTCVIVCLPVEKGNLPMAFVLHGLCATGMIRIGCGLRKYGLLLKGMITLYLSAFLWGGFWDVLMRERSMTIKTFLVSAIGTYLGLSTFLYISDSVRAAWRHIYPITLSFQGKIHKAYGFYDTGNLLTDPYSNHGVSVTNIEFLEEILSKEIAEKLKNAIEKQGELEYTELTRLHPRFIPCRTVGQETGIMLVITLDDLCIHTPREVIHISKPVFGVTQVPSALGKEYEVLLNSTFINQEGN